MHKSAPVIVLQVLLITIAWLAHPAQCQGLDVLPPLAALASDSDSPVTGRQLACVDIPTRGGTTHWPNTYSTNSNPFQESEFQAANYSTFEMSSVWRLELCTVTQAAGPAGNACSNCSGVIYVTRLVGCTPEFPTDATTLGSLFSNEQDEDVVAGASQLGPDEIFLLLEGPEMMAPAQHHSGSCLYTFKFKVTIPGVYRLSVTIVRSDWHGYWNGLNVSFPPLTLDVVTHPKQLLQLGLVSLTAGVHKEVTDAHHELPPCISHRDTSGRWVQQHLQLNMFSNEPAVHRPIVGVSGLGYHGQGFNQSYFTNLTDIRWLPYNCHWKAYSAKDAATCLAGKQLLAHGDSQTRTLYNHLAEYRCGVKFAAVKALNELHCFNDSRADAAAHSCPGLTACFKPEAFGTWNLSEAGTVDIFMANYGQHLATGGVTVSAYAKHLASYARRLGQVYTSASYTGSRLRRAIWMDTQPFPVPTHRAAYSYRCKRTAQRIRLYNDAAWQAMSSLLKVPPHFFARVYYIRTYDMLLPVLDASIDNAHLIGYEPALEALTNMLLAAACE